MKFSYAKIIVSNNSICFLYNILINKKFTSINLINIIIYKYNYFLKCLLNNIKIFKKY